MSQTIGLIGGASGKELTEQIQKHGYKVALIAGANKENGTDIADYVLTTDLRNIKTVELFLKDQNVKHIIIGTGHRFAFKLGNILQNQGIELNINYSASELAKEKRKFKDFISSRGFLTPAYVSITNEDHIPNLSAISEKIGLPCVVKSTIDTMLPQKVFSTQEMYEAIITILNTNSPVIVEQFIKGIDLTVFVSAGGNNIKALPICYYSKAEDNDMKGFSNNEYLKEKLSPEIEQSVMKYCEDIVSVSGFEGLPRVDLMVLPSGKTYVLEVNSVGVTGINQRHLAYYNGTILKLREQGIDVAEIVVENALKKFGLL